METQSERVPLSGSQPEQQTDQAPDGPNGHASQEGGGENDLDATSKGHDHLERKRQPNGQFAREPRKNGAPFGNQNAFKHGLRAVDRIAGFHLGKLPSGCSNVERAVSQLRAVLEDAVLSVHGAIGVRETDLINLACRSEQAASVARLWLVEASEKLSPAERLPFLDKVTRFTEARSKAIDRLDLGTKADGIGGPKLPETFVDVTAKGKGTDQ